MAIRYQGQIHVYEIWNEPNVKNYWSGSAEQMVELLIGPTTSSRASIHRQPSFHRLRLDGLGLLWFSSFLSAGGGRYVDVIGYHFYVDPAAPEAMVPLIQTVEAIMRAYQTGSLFGIRRPGGPSRIRFRPMSWGPRTLRAHSS